MTRLKATLTSGLITLAVCLAIFGMVLVTTNTQPVQAGAVDQLAINTIEDDTYYLPLTNAPPQRDITQQQLAPLALAQ